MLEAGCLTGADMAWISAASMLPCMTQSREPCGKEGQKHSLVSNWHTRAACYVGWCKEKALEILCICPKTAAAADAAPN